MSIFGRWDSWEDPICRVETIILFFNTRIYSRLDWSPCLQINVMQIERKENAGIMKYGIRDSWSTQEQRQSFDCDIIDMLHISCFHISVAAAARCRCRRVTPRRTFSHQNIQGQCLLPASITVVADTGHWSHTWGSGHSIVTLVTTRWRGCHSDWYAQRPRSILSRHPAEILFMPPLSSDSGSRVYPNLGTKQKIMQIYLLYCSLSSCLNIVYR